VKMLCILYPPAVTRAHVPVAVTGISARTTVVLRFSFTISTVVRAESCAENKGEDLLTRWRGRRIADGSLQRGGVFQDELALAAMHASRHARPASSPSPFFERA
jgi:hypothetical protein